MVGGVGAGSAALAPLALLGGFVQRALAGAEALGYAPYGGSGPACAVFATAHPCKFQAAVTEALGADAWAAYEASAAFPEAARALASRAEVAPLALSRRAGESLGAAQRRWETVLRAVLEDPDGLHYVESVCHLAAGDDDAPAADAPPAVAAASCAIL